MSRRRLLLPVTVVALLAACSDTTPLTPALPAVPTPQAVTAAATCTSPDPATIQNQINALFVGGQKTAALSKFSNIQKMCTTGKLAEATTKMFTLVDWTLAQYQGSKLVDGQSAGTQTKVVDLTGSLYTYVGFDAPALSPAALGPDGAVAVVYPTTSDTVIKPATGWSEVVIPAGAVSQPVLITISRIPESAYETPTDPYAGPLATSLNQYPLFYEYAVSPVVTFNVPVTVGICLRDQIDLTTAPGSRLRVAHNISATQIEILPWATPPALDCSAIQTASAAAAGPVLAQRSGLPGLMQVGMRQALEWLLPPRLQAAVPMATRSGTCCLGGLAGGFSPFGGVDTLGYLSATSPTGQTAQADSAVAAPPTVKITGDPALGALPIAGVPVTFEITAGAGTINGGTAPVVVATDASGVASLTSWVVRLGANQVRATPSYVPRTGFTPDAVTFDATGQTLCQAQTQIPVAECDALVALYTSTTGASWTTKTNWLRTLTPCGWFGISCIPAGVGLIDLHDNSLSGSIPTELGNLANLRDLWLPDNQLTGTMPASLGNLSNLASLWLSNNLMTGGIPASLGSLNSLYYLNLGFNQLSGSIPVTLGSLTTLQYLYLHENQLTGLIPASLGNLTSLRDLILNKNQLTGLIPATLGNLANLQYGLVLSDNQLAGPIPASLGDLANLQYLTLYNNQLTGSIPTSLGSLANLFYLGLSNNQLTETIPTSLGNLVNLQYLYLNSNQLTGAIPAGVGDLANLLGLGLDNNQLTGAIPASLGNLADLHYLGISNNGLTGTIPASLGNLADLWSLHVNDNQLTGPIPASLGNLANLQYLDLGLNQLTGSIPADLGNLTNLKALWLANNQLSGTVPLPVAIRGGIIQGPTNANEQYCMLFGNSLVIPDQPAYRAGDLDGDGRICFLPFTVISAVAGARPSPAAATEAQLQVATALQDRVRRELISSLEARLRAAEAAALTRQQPREPERRPKERR